MHFNTHHHIAKRHKLNKLLVCLLGIQTKMGNCIFTASDRKEWDESSKLKSLQIRKGILWVVTYDEIIIPIKNRETRVGKEVIEMVEGIDMDGII